MPELPAADSSTEATIMAATYRALRANGYAGTSISRIAEEFPKSKSLLYYHYENKDDLLTDFLAHLLDQLEGDLTDNDIEDPHERLDALLDKLAPRELPAEHVEFFQALLEMRTQAPHKPAYREQFQRTDDLIIAELTETIEAGIEDGTFATVDAERTAEFMLTSVYGMLDQTIPLENPDRIARLRDELDRYVQRILID